MPDRITSPTASGPDTVLTEPVTVTTIGADTVVMCETCGDGFVWPTARIGDAVEAFMSRHMGKHTESPSVAAGRKKR